MLQAGATYPNGNLRSVTRKRKFLHHDLNEDDIQSSQTGLAAEHPPPSFRHAMLRKACGKLIMDYRLPPEPSANWVRLEGIVFVDHLAGLDNCGIKEYVRLVTQKEEANEMSDEELVMEAMIRARANQAYDNSCAERKRHRTITTGTTENPSGRNLHHYLPDEDLQCIRQPAQACTNVSAAELVGDKAKDQLARAEAAQVRVESHAESRERFAEAAAAAAAAATAAAESTLKMLREMLPVEADASKDKFHNGVKYERKSTGLFIGKLASPGTIINIDGEDFVEYRVLTKPSSF
ncbi:DDE superfamily endonuclease, CENP-B-like protein [Purpureocillium lavendulum]|uniref:DDE superfamily endonuclease, CENP-B-like protein n=1 Tax=Purpureocillium lavendulum TaxID=1247861 RepID=A0AB34FAP4_9HYPO|nr:DDE superfamily endonuclease, CENP-B-like protein [Purpureocillium lavendulum]